MDGVILSGERRLSQKVLLAGAALAAGGFDALGVTENDAVALLLRNDLAYFEAVFGAQQIGAYAVPINRHFQAEEAAYILNDCAAKVLIVHADLLPPVADSLPDDLAVLVVETPPEIRAAYAIDPGLCDVPTGEQSWNAWLQEQTPWAEPAKAYRSSMIYTSGTTGRP